MNYAPWFVLALQTFVEEGHGTLSTWTWSLLGNAGLDADLDAVDRAWEELAARYTTEGAEWLVGYTDQSAQRREAHADIEQLVNSNRLIIGEDMVWTLA